MSKKNRKADTLGGFEDGTEDLKELIPLLCALIVEPLNRSELCRFLAKVNIRNSLGRALKISDLDSFLVLLEKQGILKFDQKIYINEEKQAILFWRAFHHPKANEWLNVIWKEFPYEREEGYWRHYGTGPYRFQRELQLALIDGNQKEFDRLSDQWGPGYENVSALTIARTFFANLFFENFSTSWFSELPASFRYIGIETIFLHCFFHGDYWFQLFPLMSPYLNHKGQLGVLCRYCSCQGLIYSGKIKEARKLRPKELSTVLSLSTLAEISCLEGDWEKGLHYFKAAFKLNRQETGGNEFNDQEQLFYLLALFRSEDPKVYKTIHAQIKKKLKYENYLWPAYKVMESLVLQKKGEDYEPNCMRHLARKRSPKTNFWALISQYLLNVKALESAGGLLISTYKHFRDAELNWPATELAKILLEVGPPKELKKELQKLVNQMDWVSVLPERDLDFEWKEKLKKLSYLTQGSQKNTDGEARLAWMVDFDSRSYVIEAKEQKRQKNGGWSKGRKVGLEKIARGNVKSMSTQDHAIAKQINVYSSWGSNYYDFDMEKALPEMAGHPYLYLLKSPEVSIELTAEEPELIAEKKGKNYHLSLSKFDPENLKLIRKTAPTRYVCLRIKPEHLQLATLLKSENMIIPEKGKNELLKSLEQLSGIIQIQSSIHDDSQQLDQIIGDNRCCLHLLAVGDGFIMEAFTKPDAKEDLYFAPGVGAPTVIAEIKGKKVKVQRDLKSETRNFKKFKQQCPQLSAYQEGEHRWMLDDPESCMEILTILSPMADNGEILVEWPKGEKIRFRGALSTKQLSLNIEKKKDWFALSGEVIANPELTLSIKELLTLLENSNGSYITLGNGDFLSLTNKFRKQLELLQACTQEKKQDLLLHPLSGLPLQELMEQTGGTRAAAWKKNQQRFALIEAKELQLPKTFQADLREYQLEGFEWLSRLAYWGVGACLADDMGLGKTLQALAILLKRADQGPSLVVAPASVCMNWHQESFRFTPTLNVKQFGVNGRKELLAGLGARDLLVCSYGILQQESEQLAGIKWQTVVLDEAQAIKNYQTKRFKAAIAIQEGFKILTTGTPIENHLSELWSLFQFINPGLLGSLQQFQSRFVRPIEKDGDQSRQRQLRQLIRPFILRRLKSQVLEELPPKTEITIHVEMSEEEASFYEAVRQKALEKTVESDLKDGQHYLQILAEISRLRRSCCHPKLVFPEAKVASSKIEYFLELVEELRSNNHKVLVFSQFVGYLKIIEAEIKARKIPYQYLDGSTPIKKRKQSVDAFQSGEGDLFLISLRAGGTGLNLTAADYVIHMDPWWNPAVEDQASDRAHRIGQDRPVTVYRLVIKNSIEEKILALHKEKRALADQLLEGTDKGSKITAEDLMNLLKNPISPL